MMDLESTGLSLEEKLIYFIDRNDINNVERLLKEGISNIGITAKILFFSACQTKTVKIMDLCLCSCSFV